MEGNPYTWDRTDWKLPYDFEVSRDFPSLEIWTQNLSGVSLNLAFRHERARNNIGQELQEENNDMRNNDRDTPRQNNDINNHIEVNHVNNRDVANETHFEYLKNILPMKIAKNQ